MSSTAVSAGQVMDRVAILLNDPNKTDYTYLVILPYLNMAIDELVESMEEANNSPTNSTSTVITIPVGVTRITPTEDPTVGIPHYPDNLVEIQEIGERNAGTQDRFIRMERKEFLSVNPPNNSLLYWIWEEQQIKFNSQGALSIRDVQIKFVSNGIPYAVDQNSIITMINSRAYLSFKTAAFCARFIGENETRAQVLDGQALEALERTTTISNKGRQEIMTRHRPFRAGYKSRGWI